MRSTTSSTPCARRRPLLALALSGTLAGAFVATVASAQTQINEVRPATADGTVSIDNLAGSVEVIGGAGSEIRVEGTLHPDVERVEIEQHGGTTRIEVIYPRRGSHHGRADLTVRVPAGSRVEVETVSADIRVDEVRGTLDIESVSGAIRAYGSPERAELATVSGKIDADLETTSLGAHTVSGGLEIRGTAPSLDVETVSGSAEVTVDGVDRGTLESVSGTVRWSGSLTPRGSLRAESFSGTVELDLPADVDATVAVSSFSGRIDNRLGTGREERPEHGPGSSLEATLGSGSARIEAESFSGTVRLRRRG